MLNGKNPNCSAAEQLRSLYIKASLFQPVRW